MHERMFGRMPNIADRMPALPKTSDGMPALPIRQMDSQS